MFKRFIDYNNEKSLAFRLRQRRARYIKELIIKCYHEFGEVKLIDIGGTAYYWKLFTEEFLNAHHVQITVLNTHLPKGHDQMPPRFSFVTGDGCQMPEFSDNHFHMVHSNSVIEHVGSWENKQRFAAEITRVAPYHYIQTPNFWFPFEPHALRFCFHWLPKAWQAHLLMRHTLGWLRQQPDIHAAKQMVEHNSLLTPRQVKSLFPHSTIHHEWIGPLIKSVIVKSSNR